MKHITAVEKLESMFYHRARPTINSNCWVITEQDFRSLILSAKAMEKEQMRLIYEGLLQNVGTIIKQSDLPTFEQYYNETYGSNTEI